VGKSDKCAPTKTGIIRWDEAERQKRYSLDGMREAYAAASFDGDEIISGVLASKELDSLALVRNVLVHNGGIADEEYVRRTKSLPSMPTADIGQPILLDGEIIANLARPVVGLGRDLLIGVDEWLRDQGVE
jgi:hypothetical protein